MRKKGSRGQVTLFVIIGLVILILAATIWYLFGIYRPEVERELIEVPTELRPLHNYITGCLRETAIDGAYLNGVQGGYAYPPNTSVVTEFSAVSLWYDDELGDLRPTQPEIESQLALYVDQMLEECTNFSSFEQQGWSVEAGEPNTTVTIAVNELVFEMEYPVDAAIEESEGRLERFRVIIPHRLSYILNTANEVNDLVVEDPGWVQFTPLLEYDLDIIVMPVSEDTIIYAFQDNRSAMRPGEPYLFMFGTTVPVNKYPVITMPERLVGVDNERFVYQIQATDPDGDELTFRSDHIMFDVEKDGSVDFVPRITGSFNVTVEVTDGSGYTDEANFEWLVLE
ncbi:hypothetical protein GF351_02715 [Candidatus Woesearchaeota archaeon]|nr:hypothetical protein [Candidatus Woesearchaeota archaeon]